MAGSLVWIGAAGSAAGSTAEPQPGLGAARDELAGPEVSRPDVLVITIDTLRPDAVGAIGGSNETPHLDRLISEGVLFDGAVSPLPLTLPAHTSLFSGLLPARHGLRDNGQTVAPGTGLLAEQLREVGYTTAAFVSGFPLESVFGLDRGFDHYDDALVDGPAGRLERPADRTADAAIAWLEEAASPWFVWVHFYDPHDPYEPPRAFWKPGTRGAYDGEVTFVDEAIGRLAAVTAPRPTLTVVTADHGEALGEHAEKTHGYFVYDSTMLVPLLFHFPERIAPARLGAAARLIDVAPTLLDLLDVRGSGVEAPGAVDGVSLRSAFEGQLPVVPPAILETFLPWTYFGWSPLRAIRTGKWKLIEAPRPELYDLTADPGETTNVLSSHRQQARLLAEQLGDLGAGESSTPAAVEDPETVEKLRALGYTVSPRREPPRRGLPDPKDRIALRDRLTLAEDLLASGRVAEAATLFEEVLAVEADNRAALLRSGVTALRRGDLELAEERLGRSIELDPHRAEARFALGDTLMRRERWAEAAQQWMEVARLQPRRVEAWANLAQAQCAAGQPELAKSARREALALEPETEERLPECGAVKSSG